MTQQSGTNGNGPNGNGNGDNGNGTLPDLTNREILKLLLDEISYVRREILEEVGIRMDRLEKRMSGMDKQMEKIAADFQGLRLEVHQNQLTFMGKLDEHDKRLAAAGA